jgi:hypothetical protein
MTNLEERKKFRDKASALIKSGAVDTALAFLSTAWVLINRGPIKWFTEKILEYVWNKTADRAVRLFMRKGWLMVDKASGSIRIRKIRKAKGENNPDEYWSTISDI